MKNRSLLLFTVLSVILSYAIDVNADQRIVANPYQTRHFATLPENVRFPEGITANPNTKEIIVGTFDFGPNSNRLLRFNSSGGIVASRDFGGTPLLGLAYNPADNKVYIANFGASEIQRIAADFGPGSAVETVAVLAASIVGAPTPRTVTNPDASTDEITFGNFFPAPNALTFDAGGNLYFSDSFQGAVFRIASAASCATPCAIDLIAHHPLLATAGFPPFGANGIALNDDETALFVANTGDDRVLKLDVTSGEVSVFSESINGADGIAMDEKGLLWLAANQADQVVALNDSGRVVAEVGEFLGLNKNGSARGLLFPASLVIVDNSIYVTNLALPLTEAIGDEPEEEVSTYTITKLPKHLKPESRSMRFGATKE